MEEKVMYGVLTVYRERGYYLHRLEQFEKSKASYDEALKYFPNDLRLLIGLSQVCSDAAQPLEAYENAKKALEISPSNMNSRNVQANALYALCNFESSLVMNYRGARQRTKPQYFLEGISQNLEILEDCIGKNAGPVMVNFLPIIEKHLQEQEISETKKHVSRIPNPEQLVNLTKMQIQRQESLSRVIAMKCLGPMASDKFFLQKLKMDNRLMSANKIGSKHLKNLVEKSYNSLTDRQEMLSSQRPYYCIKYAEKTESNHQNKFKKELLQRDRIINTRTAYKLIRSVENAMRDLQIMTVMTLAERLQKFLDAKTPRDLPDKYILTDRLYRAVGDSYLSMHRLSYRLSDQGNRQRVAFLMGLPTGRPKSFDSVRACYPYKFMDLKIATEHVKEVLSSCENSYMRCWLMYELSSMLNKQKNYTLAKFYAKRCQYEAESLQSHVWWLNGCFALMTGEMKQGNANEVRLAVEEAYKYAKKLPNRDQIQCFLLKCLEVANEPIVTSENKIIKQREDEIVRTLDPSLKVHAHVLFKRMSVLPTGRRFKPIPSQSTHMTKESERTKYRQRGLTIIPGMQKSLTRMPRSDVAGFQVFDVKQKKKP